jgi:predicted nucleic acid-binding protein
MAIFNLLKYKLESNKELKFIVDTNIWLYLYSHLHEDKEREIAAYSNLLEEIIENEYEIFLPSLILSEFTNVLLRADYNYIKDSTSEEFSFKKNYVGSANYLEKVKEIQELLEEILNIENIVKIDDEFSNINIEKIKNSFEKIDWNDSYLIQLAKIKGATIVTHDRDFDNVQAEGFDVIRLF